MKQKKKERKKVYIWKICCRYLFIEQKVGFMNWYEHVLYCKVYINTTIHVFFCLSLSLKTSPQFKSCKARPFSRCLYSFQNPYSCIVQARGVSFFSPPQHHPLETENVTFGKYCMGSAFFHESNKRVWNR